uniref:STAS domain-containing protein n=1 Tax=Acrobeloides nanus TaxID=290746 RepID=A0A914CHL7_9BILA
MDLPIRFEISRRIYNQDAFDKEYKHTPLSKNKKSSFFENFPRCNKDELKSTLFTWIPLFDWVPKYKLNNLLPDLMAGFTVAILSIPQAMAYASLANVPEVIGLYTSFFPCILYAIFGTSQHVSLGMFAVIALLVNSVQKRFLPNSNSTEFSSDMRLEDLPSVQLMVTLTFTVGLVMVVMAVLQLHILASYLCDPLIKGFTTASAIHIIVLQIPPMLQIGIGQHSGVFNLIYCVLSAIIFVVLLNVLKQFGELKSLWKTSKYDFTIWIFSFFVTILWDVSQGLVASIVFSLFTIIVRIQWADTKQIAKIGDTELYKDIESHPVYHYRPDVSIFHFNAPLLYVNSERFKEHALNIISDAQTSYFKPQFLILDASGITSCDKIGALTISELAEELSQNHVTLLIACPSEKQVQNFLEVKHI